MARLTLLLGACALGLAGGAGLPPITSVFGHKVPDTDAICAAMIYQWELEERGIAAKAFRLGELNKETEYVLRVLGLEQPPLLEGKLDGSHQVAIVDTNNPAELPEGVDSAATHSIVDHHKLCGLTTQAPLEIDVRPLCSTGSILYLRAKAAGRAVPRLIAGLMLSCILSDSLEFRSPTTTPTDIEIAKELAEIAGLDLHAHAEGMLDAKADVSHLQPKQIAQMDSKVFTIGGRKLRVSVVETIRPSTVLKQKDALLAAQRELAAEQQLDDVLLFVIDVINETATFLSSSPTAAALVEASWEACFVASDSTCIIPGVLSRKKQIIPALEKAAAKGPLRTEGNKENSVSVEPQASVSAN
jgi:manganese-dependent inorganic pyrophosphatase